MAHYDYPGMLFGRTATKDPERKGVIAWCWKLPFGIVRIKPHGYTNTGKVKYRVYLEDEKNTRYVMISVVGEGKRKQIKRFETVMKKFFNAGFDIATIEVETKVRYP